MRNRYSLNKGWTLTFPKGERETETVNLPHTWNAVDGMDGNCGLPPLLPGWRTLTTVCAKHLTLNLNGRSSASC